MKTLNTNSVNKVQPLLRTRFNKLGQWKSAACIALLASSTAMPAMSAPALYNFQEVADPMDTMFTQLLGVNNNGQIAGYFGDGTKVPNNGFTLTLTGHHLLPNFTSENFPNATQTQVISINNLSKTGGFYVDAQGQTHGFIRDNNGVYQKIDAPKTAFNQILGVNDLGESAGYSSTDPTGATIQKAFIHNSAGFVYVPLKAPSIGNSQATGINDANIVSGFYVDANGNNFGFLWDTNNKTIKSLQYPKANFTQALGINNAGQVVGVYSMDNGATTHGFVYKQGQYTRVDEPNSANLSATLINGINDRGEIVGFYTDKAGDTVGFIGTPKTPLW